MAETSRLAICIPTYQRPRQLQALIEDLLTQTLSPDILVVVDGDPASGEVSRYLSQTHIPLNTAVIYVPSNHGSLPYQRYLGWRIAKKARWLLYLDDDLRLKQADFVAKIVEPLTWAEGDVVGVTSQILFGDASRLGPGNFQSAMNTLTARGPRGWHKLMNLGSIGRGEVSPSGHRRGPGGGGNYEPVEWLSGGVMALRASAITESCFPEIGFALFQSRLGTGEDLVIARCMRQTGTLLFAQCVSADHPYEAGTNFGPQTFFRLGITMSYGERYVNDYFRGGKQPMLSDRLALIRSYAGTFLLNWARFLRHPEWRRWLYAAGFTVGTVMGLVGWFTVSRLAPEVDWRADAEAALAGAIPVTVRAGR